MADLDEAVAGLTSVASGEGATGASHIIDVVNALQWPQPVFGIFTP